MGTETKDGEVVQSAELDTATSLNFLRYVFTPPLPLPLAPLLFSSFTHEPHIDGRNYTGS